MGRTKSRRERQRARQAGARAARAVAWLAPVLDNYNEIVDAASDGLSTFGAMSFAMSGGDAALQALVDAELIPPEIDGQALAVAVMAASQLDGAATGYERWSADRPWPQRHSQPPTYRTCAP